MMFWLGVLVALGPRASVEVKLTGYLVSSVWVEFGDQGAEVHGACFDVVRTPEFVEVTAC